MHTIVKSVARFCSVFAGLSLLALSVSASAEETGMRPCADDIAKFCKDVKPGGGRIESCLKEHQNDLSVSCKERMALAGKKRADVSEACSEDASKLCKDIKPGGGRIIRCLKEHSTDLSVKCKEALPQGRR